jgi:hypothetical protein
VPLIASIITITLRVSVLSASERPLSASDCLHHQVSKALLAGRLVLSERSHPKDEAEFAGLGISFYDNMSAIATAYEALVHSYSSFGPMGAGALADATRRIRAFRRRFAPRLIFERAHVYRDWGMGASVAS